MFDLNLAALQPLRLWLVVALLLLLFVISIKAVRRSGSFGPVTALFGVPALAVIAWSAWNFADQAILRQRVAEREALNARALQLTAMAMAPGSALACVDAGAEIAEACAKTLFQKPEAIAGATSFVEARLRLLADSLDYATRADRNYDRAIVQLRRNLEADRYGFVAYVLATRDGCSADACPGFALFNDASAVKANMAAQTLENTIARHAGNGAEQTPVAAAVPSPAETPPPATMTSVPATKPIDFPSAASIPPVSIMTDAPAAAAPAEAPARKPAAPATRSR